MSLVDEHDEHNIFLNKKTDRVYVGKQFNVSNYFSGKTVSSESRPARIASQVIDSKECHDFAISKGQTVLRVTSGSRQEIVAKFYEDNRGIFNLQFQKYSANGTPHKVAFCFQGDEITTLLNFIQNISKLPLKGECKQIFETGFLQANLTNHQLTEVFNNNPELLKTVEEVIRNDVKQKDIIALAHRKEQLRHFDRLLKDKSYFENEKENTLGGAEAVWQRFFEENSWILGYGLNYVINTALEGRKLEAVVKGNDVFSAGKRVDLLMKTQGIINSLCFGEIKTHTTPLLKRSATDYRPECWSISEHLAGGISQIQKTVQKSLTNIQTRTQVKDKSGDLTGEEICLYNPKSFLIIGSLSEFKSDKGINEDKYSSFEIFRRNIKAPEILTFDELYERAQYIVETA